MLLVTIFRGLSTQLSVGTRYPIKLGQCPSLRSWRRVETTAVDGLRRPRSLVHVLEHVSL